MEPNTQFSPRVSLAIDDLRLRRTNEAGLRSAGFAVSAPSDADAVSVLAESFSPDVLVVDTDMQKMIRESTAANFPRVERFRQRKREAAFNSGRYVADELLAIAFDPARRPRDVAVEALARLALQVQHRKDLLDGIDLVRCHDLVGLAERAHDGDGDREQHGVKRGFQGAEQKRRERKLRFEVIVG